MNDASRRRAIAFVAALTILMLSAACSIGGDDATPSATTGTVDSSPTTGQSAGSPDAHTSPTRVGSPVAGSPTSSGSPTAAASPTRSATATATRAPSPTATAIPETAIGEIVLLDPATVPNYTLAISLSLAGIGGSDTSTFDYSIQQSATDRFHLKADSSGTSLELWKIGDTSFIAQSGGEPAPLPEGSDTALFSPETFLQVIPPIDSGAMAQDLGTETIDGRTAHHFRLSADNFLSGVSFLGGQAFSAADGELDIWVDDELKTFLRQQGEISWKNADGSDGNFKIDYELTQIGSTPEVQPPATP